MQWKWARLEDLPAAELHELLALRQRVFVVEQRCPYQDADALDLEAWHLLGSREASLLAYLRASPPRGDGDGVALARVVVAAEARGQGLGRAVVVEGMRRVREAFGELQITLEAQSHLVDFYRSLGFEVCGAEYLEDGILHRPMRTER
jgi:ElaA protein